MEYFVIFIIWLIFCFVASSMAKTRGRDQLGYFILAVLLSPLLSIIILLISGNSDSKRQEIIIEEEEIRNSIKDKTPPVVSIVSSTTKYENLEKIGNLLEKGLITKEEFEIEKKSILSESSIDNKNEYIPSKTINPTEIELCEQLHIEIGKSKNSFLGKFNSRLAELINQTCVDEKQAIDLLINYQRLYKKDLIKNISGLSTSYNTIKEYLSPLIEKGIIDNNFPHNRLK